MIYEITAATRTVRSFDESRPVARETILAMIDAARLSPSAMNAQPLRYKIVTDKETAEKIVSMTKYGGALPELHLPPEGHHPTAFVAVCTAGNGRFDMFDAGLACQTMMLRAHEEGVGGVILASFDPDKLSKLLQLPEGCRPIVVIALGVPDEKAKIVDVPESGKTSYYRDENNVHCVPKRALEDILL